MGASNFHNVCASRVFYFPIEDDWSWDDMDSNINSAIEAAGGDLRTKTDPSDLRSYASKVLGSFSEKRSWSDFACEITITAVARSGYYEGGNLDWFLSVEAEGYESDFGIIAGTLENYVGWSRSMARYKGKFAEKWAEAARDRLVKKMEDIFAQYTTPLGIAAQFSNGETIYKEVK